MNKLILLFLICLFSLAAYAVENEQKVFHATFIDNMNTTTLVQNIQYKCDYIDKSSTNNKFVVCGKRGRSDVTIPWSKIKRIDFLADRKNYNCLVSLNDGRSILIYAELSRSKYKGENNFGGSFSINAEYVSAIIFN